MERAALIDGDALDLEHIEREMLSADGATELPGTAAKATTQQERYRAPATTDKGPDLLPKGSASPQAPQHAHRNGMSKRGRSFFREMNADFATEHRHIIYGDEKAKVTSLRAELEEVYPCMIKPDRWPRELWNFAQVFLLIYVAILVPFRIGFDIDVVLFTAEWWWELFVNLYFIADLVLNFYTGYYDTDDMLEMRKGKVAQNYLKFWFWIDCVSCFPIDYVQLLFVDQEGSGSNLKMLKILRLVRMTKLLRLAKLRDIMYQHEEQLERIERAGKLIGAALLVLYSCHIFGCMWFFVGAMGSSGVVGPGADVEEPGWIHARGIDTTTPVSSQYLTSFYWAITVLTTVGFGDISAVSNAEMIFSSVAEITGCFMFATLMGSVAAIVLGERILKERVTQQMEALNDYLRSKNIPSQLRTQVRVFLEDVYERKAFDEREMLNALPSEMRVDMQHVLYKEIQSKIPFLSRKIVGEAVEIVTVVSDMLMPRMCMERENVYEVDDVGAELYVIIEGQVTLHDQILDGIEASYYRVLTGFTDAKSPENMAYCEKLKRMGMPELRREAMAKGISRVKWKRQETLEEIRQELKTLPLRGIREIEDGAHPGLFERAIDDGIQTAKVQLLLAPEKFIVIPADGDERHDMIQQISTGVTTAITDRCLGHPHWSDSAAQIKAKCVEFGSADAAKRELLIDMIMHFTEFVLRDASMSVAIKSEQPSFDVFEPIQGDDLVAFAEARQSIIDEMVVSPGAVFGERELFFSRRDFVKSSLHTYHAAGREYKRLPLVARKRHQTATVTSSRKAELMWMKWSDVIDLHTSHSYAGRQVYNWIEKMAKLREEDDRVNSNKLHLQNTIKHMSKQHVCAVRLQRAFKRKQAAREAIRAEQKWRSEPMGRAILSIAEKLQTFEELQRQLAGFSTEALEARVHAQGLMTPELQATLSEATKRWVGKMKEDKHRNLQELKRGGQAAHGEFQASRIAKVEHIEMMKQEQRKLLEGALLDAKRRQSQVGPSSQRMDAVLAALQDVSQRLAKLENRS